MPEITLNPLAIVVAIAVAFFVGFIWFTVLFGRSWAVEMGFDPDMQPEKSEMFRGMALNVLGNVFLVWVFAHNIAVWNPETWGAGAQSLSPLAYAAMAAFFTWLGFFVPVQLSAVAWERRSWKLFAINGAYHFLTLLLVALILVLL